MDRRDLVEIADEIARMADDVHVIIVSQSDTAAAVPAAAWDRPTMTVCFGSLGQFAPLRGSVFQNRPLSKLEQYECFKVAGIRTPRTALFEFGRHYDPADWGEFVILKPAPYRLSSKARVYLFRSERLSGLRPHHLDPTHPARRSAMLVQPFIDTGVYPTSHRVLTLFGTPIHSMRKISRIARPPLDKELDRFDAVTVATNDDGRKADDPLYPHFELFVDDEILATAPAIYRAMPSIPLQGCDFLRDANSGALYALEFNPAGNTWHISSRSAVEARKLVPRRAYIDQFGAWKVAARTLIEQTRAHAT